MKLQNELKNINFVENVTKVSLPVSLQNKYKNVEILKFSYAVKNLEIIGYICAPKRKTKLPCIIHLRGGSDAFGMLTIPKITRQMAEFAQEGYVVISTQYPGVEGGGGKDTFGGVDDILSIKKLRSILQKLSITNHHRVGIKGHSRGGLMAYMLLRECPWVKAAVIAGAPTNQFSQTKERKGWKAHQKIMWGSLKAETTRRSPILWVNKLTKKCPILLMHGSSDWRVKASHSIQMSRDLFDKQIPHRFILFDGADHSLTEYKNEYRRQSIGWFERFLKDNEKLPNMKLHGK